jgi:serine phosphatase RsbU (regulator of sigma subunit)
VRTSALQETQPAAILATLNQAMLAQLRPANFCSVACATLTVDDGTVNLRVSCGGHPLPMVRRAGGAIEEVGEYGTLLGIVDNPHLPASTVELEPGDAFLLYTDGVFDVGARRRAEWGPELVRELLAGAPAGDAAAIVARLEGSALDAQDGRPRDDIAILATARQS